MKGEKGQPVPGKGSGLGENKTEGGAREKVAPEGGGGSTPRRVAAWNGMGAGLGMG